MKKTDGLHLEAWGLRRDSLITSTLRCIQGPRLCSSGRRGEGQVAGTRWAGLSRGECLPEINNGIQKDSCGAGEGQWLVCLPSVHGDPGLVPSPTESRPGGAYSEGGSAHGHLPVYSEFLANGV